MCFMWRLSISNRKDNNTNIIISCSPFISHYLTSPK